MENPSSSKRITYSESRTINIGDYESIKCELRYSTLVEKKNELENTIEIMYSDTCTIEEEKESTAETINNAMARVKQVLNMREADIRIKSAKYTEHNTEEKGFIMGLFDLMKLRKKRKQTKIDMKMLNDYDKGNIHIEG